MGREAIIAGFCFLSRIQNSPNDRKVEEEYQAISRSLSVPTESVSSEILELASNNRPGGDSIPNEDIQHLCDPTTGVEKTEKNASGEIENRTHFGARTTSPPKLHLNRTNAEKTTVTNTAENSITEQSKEVKEGGKSSRNFVSSNLKMHNGSPRLQRGQGRSDSGDKMKSTRPFCPVPKKESVLDNYAREGRQGIQAESWKDQVPEQERMYDKTSRTHLSPRMQYKSHSPVLEHSAFQRGHIEKNIVTARLSPRLQKHNCTQIEEEGFRAHNQAANESEQNRFVKIAKESFGVEKRPRSPSSPNLRVNNRRSGLRGRSWSLTNQMPKLPGEVEVNSLSTSPRCTPLRKKRDLSKPESLNTQAWETECFSKEKERVCRSNTQEITGATSASPQLKHRLKSVPFSDCKVSQIAMNSRDGITKKYLGNNEQIVSQARAISKGPKMLQKRGWEVPNSLPQSEKLEMPVEAANQSKCPNVTIEVVESEDDIEKVDFSDVKAQLPLPVNQPNSHLSVISVKPLHRRSTGDIHEACLREELVVNYLNGYEMKSSPKMQRVSVKNRASSMSELHESSKEKKTFSSITAFNLATHNPAGHKTAVKFREITEPVRKSKWFHALTNVVNLNYFQAAMMEIQKQKERDKASEENRPSMEKTFEDIKNCRYLRVPEHYQ